MDDPLYVHVSVSDDQVVAIVEGVGLSIEAMSPDKGTIALYMEGQARSPFDPAWRQAIRQLAAPLIALDADTGWQAVWTFGPGEEPTWSHDFRRLGLEGWQDADGAWLIGPTGDATTGWTAFLARDVGWKRGRLSAVLQRGQGTAGIVVGGDGVHGGGLLLLVRPIHRDLIVWRLHDGIWQGPVGGAAWLRPWHSALKDLLRLLLRPYFAGLALVGLATLVGFGTSRLMRALSGWEKGGAGPRAHARRAPRPDRAWDGRGRAPALLVPGGRGRLDGPEDCAADQTDAQGTPTGAHALVGPSFNLEASTFNPLVWLAVGLLSSAAVLAAGLIADRLLERMPHVQDSVGYLFQARVFARGALWAPTPALPDFFDHEFVVRTAERWFAKYPPGFPALLALGVLAGVPWLVNPLAAGLSVVATYLIGQRTAGRGVGLLAGLLLAISPFFLILAGSHMAHTTGLLFGLLFVLAYVEMERGSRRAAFAAGLALGIDMLIRPWTAAMIAAPFGLDLLLRRRRAPGSARAGALWLALGLAPAPLVYGAYNWILAGSPLTSTMELWWSFDRIGFGQDKGIAGHTPLNGLYNTVWNLSLLAVHTFGWPAIATFALALVPFAAGRPSRWDRLFLAGWLCLMLGYFFWWADGVMYGPRFYHEATGFLALLTARGLASLGRLGGAPGRALAGALLVLLLAVNLSLYMPVQLAALHGYNYVSHRKLDAVERAGIHNAVVFVDTGRPNEWWEYGMVFSANSPWLDTDVIYARDLGPLDRHLMAHYPGRAFYRLVGTSLARIDTDS
jgi:hypothetical protein